jgi:hypothetical protein
MTERKKLSDIVNGNAEWFNNDNWDNIPAAPDFGAPIPPGKYIAHLRDAEPFKARQRETPGIKLHFEIIEGDYKGRRAWYDIWLTAAAKSQAVRDFKKLGIKSREQLEGPIPRWIRCRLHVAINKSDNGEEYNRVKTFEVLGIDKEEPDAFAPPPSGNLPPSNNGGAGTSPALFSRNGEQQAGPYAGDRR